MDAPSSALTCPHCRAPVAASDVNCPACGTNLALAMLVSEHDLYGRARAGGPPQAVSVEQLVPRLGDFLVSKHYVSEAQLQTALRQQAAVPAGQPRPLLGQTLVATGALTPETLDKAVAQQVLELQAALLEANRGLEARVAARTAELQATLVKLQEFNQLKTNFVSNISHELRTPLAQIRGYVELLADEALGPLTPEQRQGLQISQQAVERLEGLINDLIAYASAAKGELMVLPTAVPTEALVAEVLARAQAKAARAQVSLTADLTPNLPAVHADRDKLRWTLAQLIDNGIKFTPAGGSVTVRVASNGRGLTFTVRDTGIGIPAQKLADIFEPFQQLDGSATRRYGGTGLGLALVRRIVEAHGARVLVESEEGRGTAVGFTLPSVSS
jgi:signal transduction histidine kinase